MIFVPLLAAFIVPGLSAAQEPAAPTGTQEPAQPTTAPAPATPQPPPAADVAPAAREQRAQSPETRVEHRRQAIRMMEAILSRAVLGGAETLAEQLGSGNPNISFFTGQARARGFILEGYGVFFHVEIPEMQSSLVMSLSTMERDVAVADTIDSLRSAFAAMADGAAKIQAEEALKRLQLQVGPLPPVAQLDAPPMPRNVVRATDSVPLPDPGARVPMPLLRDPSAVYREAIKMALVDAMLEHSRGMNIQPEEWLTVAAHRGDSPLAPNEIVTSPTLVLRVKGSDLAIYDADRTRKDEIRKRVEVREF